MNTQRIILVPLSIRAVYKDGHYRIKYELGVYSVNAKKYLFYQPFNITR